MTDNLHTVFADTSIPLTPAAPETSQSPKLKVFQIHVDKDCEVLCSADLNLPMHSITTFTNSLNSLIAGLKAYKKITFLELYSSIELEKVKYSLSINNDMIEKNIYKPHEK